MKKILIVSNFFYPEITPRAFRTTELVKEFCRQGDTVTLVLPNKEIYQAYPFKCDNLTIVYSSSKLQKQKNFVHPTRSKNIVKKQNLQSRILRLVKDLGLYLFPRQLFIVYDRGLTHKLKTIAEQFDGIISIAQPLSIHLSVCLAVLQNRRFKAKTLVAEFSDPMFNGEYKRTFPINWLFGFLFGWVFNFFVVPVAAAIPAFRFFKSKSKIKVIPQGFDLNNITVRAYRANTVVTFAYAGRFYNVLRDPQYFFDYLTTLDQPFIFKIYTDLSDSNFFFLFKKYESKIKGTLILNKMVPREQLIEELSEVDFLVNFENENSKMVPSKLIDYALTTRPIISFNSKTFNSNVFSDFLCGLYDNQIKINQEYYNIKNIIKSFKELFVD